MKTKIPRNRPYIPQGCGQQGRYPEGAHAASEIDDWRHDPLWWVTDVVVAVCLTAAVLFVLAIAGLFL